MQVGFQSYLEGNYYFYVLDYRRQAFKIYFISNNYSMRRDEVEMKLFMVQEKLYDPALN